MTTNHRPRSVIPLLVLGLACIAALYAYRFAVGLTLRLPGELFFLIEGPAIIAFALTPMAIAIRSLICSSKALIKRDAFPSEHLLTFGVLTTVLWLPGMLGISFYNVGVTLKIRTVGEAAYLSLAQEIRTTLRDKGPGFPTTSYDFALHDTSKTNDRKRLEFLGTILPEDSPAAAQWPRSMLDVTVEKDHVRISRGSGMLGQLGVVILDRTNHLEQYSAEELSENSYLPRYRKITDRLYVVESD